jgi:hypothetical protein
MNYTMAVCKSVRMGHAVHMYYENPVDLSRS